MTEPGATSSEHDQAAPERIDDDDSDSRYSTTLASEVDPGDTAVESPVFDGWGPGRTGTTQSIAPQSGQVNPPTGVLRAQAKGVFDISRRPIPEPKEPPRYAGDLSLEELSHYGIVGSSPAALGITDQSFDDQRPTLEIEVPPSLFGLPVEGGRSPSQSDTLPGPALATSDVGDRVTPQEGEDEFQPIGVKVSQPVQESGIWRGHGRKDSGRDDATAPPRTFGMVAAILVLIAAAGVTYFVMMKDDARKPGPGKQSKGQVTDVKAGADDDGAGSDRIGPLPEPATVDQRLASAERLLERGRRVDAHHELDTVLMAQPKNTRALVLRSSLLVEERKLEAALVAAQASVDADPTYADGHLALAVVREERGDTTQAVAEYRRFLELAPSSELAPAIEGAIRRLEEDPADVEP
jgi:hypothetical protein